MSTPIAIPTQVVETLQERWEREEKARQAQNSDAKKDFLNEDDDFIRAIMEELNRRAKEEDDVSV
mgnify:CR=1 FL=1